MSNSFVGHTKSMGMYSDLNITDTEGLWAASLFYIAYVNNDTFRLEILSINFCFSFYLIFQAIF